MSAEDTYRDALLATLTAAFAADELVQVSDGHPGPTPSPDIVALMSTTTDQEPGPLGPARSREETLTATVIVSSYLGGGAEVQTLVNKRALAIKSAVVAAIRADVSLGGAVRTCGVVGSELDMDIAYAQNPYDAGDPIPIGRVTEISVQIRAVVRI